MNSPLSRTGRTQPANAAFEDLDVYSTFYFIFWSPSKQTQLVLQQAPGIWTVQATFMNNAALEQIVVGWNDWGLGWRVVGHADPIRDGRKWNPVGVDGSATGSTHTRVEWRTA